MKINKRNLIIYGIGLAISIVLLSLYFICPKNPLCVVSCSVGASGIGAVVLAFFIEEANEKTRAENRKNVRAAKLSPYKLVATGLLEECISCYFKKRDKLRNISKNDECHKITFDELWIEMQTQEEFTSQLKNERLLESLQRIEDTLRRRCELSTKRIDENLLEIKMFEAEGYFDTEEVEYLSSASQCISDTICVDDSLDMESLKIAFECFCEIEEFKFLKNTTFYYKNRRTDYIFSRRYNRRRHLTDDDIASAISYNERRTQDIVVK